MLRTLRLALLFSAAASAAHAAQAEPLAPLASSLIQAAPGADPKVIRLAVAATQCAVAHGMNPAERLAVIDYSLPSTQPRLWVFDLAQRKLLYRELVAHGRNSGDNYARHFSNEAGSLQSSLGLFRTLGTYQGQNGYSLRLDGLESGVNDRALERAIVMHGAPYVNASLSSSQGRIGRSWGCPALRAGIAREVIDALKGGQLVFSYYPDTDWLATSQYLHCADGLAQMKQADKPPQG